MGEYGIGFQKVFYMILEYDVVVLDVMCLIKKMLDLNNIFNLGKMVLEG